MDANKSYKRHSKLQLFGYIIMATNNAINLKSSGIVSYDAAGTFSALANPLIVTNGGSGAGSFTPYGVICGGTSSSSALQNIATGSSGDVLKSNGASALPSFQTVSDTSGRFVTIQTRSGSPTDATTYYLIQALPTTAATASSNASTRIYLCSSTSISAVYGAVDMGTTGSSENCTINIRKNDTTNYAVTTTLQLNTSPVTFNNVSSLGTFASGDFIDVTLVCPTWVTNPLNVFISLTIYFS